MRRDVFQAISDPVRREIVDLLAKDALTINEVAEQFQISRPAISKHLKVLEECGLISIDQQGRERLCKIEPQTLVPAFMWIDQHRALWEARVDRFEDYLMNLKQTRQQDGE